MVVSSDDLVELSRQTYAKPASIDRYNRDDLVAGGLTSKEQQLLEHIPSRTGRLLLLGVGGGREAIPFAQMGFDVTGVDFIPAMVERAIANAARHNAPIQGIVQDIAVLDVPAEAYDVVWLSTLMYSCLPTRARRVQLLQRVRRALKPGGCFACQFYWDTPWQSPRKGEFLRRMIAWLTWGNRSYERGDMLSGNKFIHAFSSESDLRADFAAAGFHVAWLNIPTDGRIYGEALLQKREA